MSIRPDRPAAFQATDARGRDVVSISGAPLPLSGQPRAHVRATVSMV
jgi:hypothetical protein